MFCFLMLGSHGLPAQPPVGLREGADVSCELLSNFCGGNKFELGEEEFAERVKMYPGAPGLWINGVCFRAPELCVETGNLVCGGIGKDSGIRYAAPGFFRLSSLSRTTIHSFNAFVAS